MLLAAVVRFVCCPVASPPPPPPPRAPRGPRPPLEVPLRRIDSWKARTRPCQRRASVVPALTAAAAQVAPAVLTELPDGTMVAALPRSKTGALRGRSFWGSGGQGWSDALAGLRAHWPGGGGREDEARGGPHQAGAGACGVGTP